MRNFSQFCRKGFAMWILVLALACPALAGQIPFPGVVEPPPPAATGDVQFPGVTPSATTGDIPYPGVALDSTEGIALILWQSVLSIF